jgi:hypothetical protein
MVRGPRTDGSPRAAGAALQRSAMRLAPALRRGRARCGGLDPPSYGASAWGRRAAAAATRVRTSGNVAQIRSNSKLPNSRSSQWDVERLGRLTLTQEHGVAGDRDDPCQRRHGFQNPHRSFRTSAPLRSKTANRDRHHPSTAVGGRPGRRAAGCASLEPGGASSSSDDFKDLVGDEPEGRPVDGPRRFQVGPLEKTEQVSLTGANQ